VDVDDNEEEFVSIGTSSAEIVRVLNPTVYGKKLLFKGLFAVLD